MKHGTAGKDNVRLRCFFPLLIFCNALSSFVVMFSPCRFCANTWKGRKGEPDGCTKKAQRIYQEDSGWLYKCWMVLNWSMLTHCFAMVMMVGISGWCRMSDVWILVIYIYTYILGLDHWFPWFLWPKTCTLIVAALGVETLKHHVLDTLDSPSLTAVRGFESNFRGCETAVEATITCLENKLEELRHDIQQKTLLGWGKRTD